MRQLTRTKRWFGTALVTAILLGPTASVAAAAEIWEILSFKQQGISDDVLIALIESDGSEFHLTAPDVQMLHNKGLSDRVILAMLKTAKKRGDVPAPPPPAVPRDVPLLPVDPNAPPPDQMPPSGLSAPVEIFTEPPPAEQPAEPPPPQIIEVYVPVPVEVPVVVSGSIAHHSRPPVASPPIVTAPAVKPEYWGWGGERRPGTWDEPSRVVVAKPAGPNNQVGSNGLGAQPTPKRIGGS